MLRLVEVADRGIGRERIAQASVEGQRPPVGEVQAEGAVAEDQIQGQGEAGADLPFDGDETRQIEMRWRAEAGGDVEIEGDQVGREREDAGAGLRREFDGAAAGPRVRY